MSSKVQPSETAADAEAAADVLIRFRQVFTATRAHYQQVEKQVGIGGAQVWALGIIGAQPGLGVGGLARAMHIHQSTASNLVRALVARGLVITAREASDRRAVQLRLLPAGQDLLDKAPGPYTGLLVAGARAPGRGHAGTSGAQPDPARAGDGHRRRRAGPADHALC